jgi:hypothetical protein
MPAHWLRQLSGGHVQAIDAEVRAVTTMSDVKSKKKKANPHCPVEGCRAQTPHAADPLTKELIQEFGPPAKMVTWALAAMTELKDSICRDLAANKVLAWYTRLRQPEELYVTVLYALFIADEKELHHILSGKTPNGLSRRYDKVNEVVLGGRGLLQVTQPGAGFGTYKPIDMLHAGAHASFPAFMTCIGIARNPSALPSQEVYAKHLATCCTCLNYMREMFDGGKAKEHILAGS